MEYKQVNGYARITYIALFDEYVVEYGGRAYETEHGHCMFGGSKKKFAALSECESFCSSIGATIVDKEVLDHPLAHGLPDCRAILGLKFD